MLVRNEISYQEQNTRQQEEQEAALGSIQEAYQALEDAVQALVKASQCMGHATETFSTLKTEHGKINKAVRYVTGLQGALYSEHRSAKIGQAQEFGNQNMLLYEGAKGKYRAALRAAEKGNIQAAIVALGDAIKKIVSLPPGALSTAEELKAINNQAMKKLKEGNAEAATYLLERCIVWLRRGTLKL